MLKYLIIAIITFYSSSLFSQELNKDIDTKENNEEVTETYKIPFSSKGNIIELSVENSSINDVENLTVKAVNVPGWIKLNQNEIKIQKLQKKESLPVLFSFDVDKSSPTQKQTSLEFIIESGKDNQTNKDKWLKKIQIEVLNPDKYELYQNYPNPFNPETVISFQLPNISKVEIKIFDMLGREISTLVNEIKQAGFYKLSFNGSSLSSGVYFYRIYAKELNQSNPTNQSTGKDFTQIKKMMVVK